LPGTIEKKKTGTGWGIKNPPREKKNLAERGKTNGTVGITALIKEKTEG